MRYIQDKNGLLVPYQEPIMRGPLVMKLRSSGGGGGTGLNHGDNFTVTGTSLGTGSDLSLKIFDQCTATAQTNPTSVGWTGAWPNNASNVSDNTWLTYRASQRSTSLVHTRNGTTYLCGNHRQQNSDQGGNVMVWMSFTRPSFPFYIYSRWYDRLDDAWDVTLGTGGGPPNIKWWDYSNGTEPYGGNISGSSDLTQNWYWEHNPVVDGYDSAGHGFADATGLAPTWHMNDDDSNIDDTSNWWGSTNGAVVPYFTYPGTGTHGGGWRLLENEVMVTSTANGGYNKIWENGSQQLNKTGISTDKMSGTTRTVGLGGYTRATGASTQWRYMQDPVIQLGRSRVILGDATTLSASTIREYQKVNGTWTSTSIPIKVNLGKFSNGATAYFHVVNESGTTRDNVMGAQTLGS